MLQYRIARDIYQSTLPYLIKRPILILIVIWQKILEIVTGISVPYTASIGPGLYIGHFGNVIVNGNSVIGANCNISQGVTIGVSGRGPLRGVPTIGDRVYMGAAVAGKISVGNDVVIAANSLVTHDIPSKCTVVGVPAVIVNSKGSDAYISGA